MRDEAELLYKTYATGSGASPGAGRILRACHTLSGRTDIEDLFRLNPERLDAAVVLLETTVRFGAEGVPLSDDQIPQLCNDWSLD